MKNRDKTRYYGILALAFVIGTSVFISNSRSIGPSSDLQDLRIRTAIYQAALLAIPAEGIAVKSDNSNTYSITGVSRIDVSTLEQALHQQFNEKGLNFDIELGVYRTVDDSLLYGNRILADAATVQSSGIINSELSNVVIFLPQPHRGNVWVWGIVLVVLLVSLILLLMPIPSSLRQMIAQIIIRKNQDSSLLHLGMFSFDPKTFLLSHPTFNKRLTYKEGQLMTLFLRKPNQLLSRNEILEQVWEADGFFVARSMDVFISKLRKYISVDGDINIDNVRGVGYVLRYNPSS